MKKIFELVPNQTDKFDVGSEIWDWLKEKGYVRENDFEYLIQKLHLIVEIME